MAVEKAIASSGGTSTASESAVAHNHQLSFFGFFRRFLLSSTVPKIKKNLVRTVLEPLRLTKRKTDSEITEASSSAQRRTPRPRVLVRRLVGPRLRSKQSATLPKNKKIPQRTVAETLRSISRKSEPEITVASVSETLRPTLRKSASAPCLTTPLDLQKAAHRPEKLTEVSGSGDASEEKNKTEKAQSSLFAKGLNAGQIATGYEQCEIQVPIDMVDWILGKAGETVRDLSFYSRTRVELFPPNPSDIEQSKEWIVRITGGKKEMETGRQLVKEVMDLAKEDIRKGEIVPCSQWFKAKFGNHAPQKHNVPQPTRYAQGGPTTHSGHSPKAGVSPLQFEQVVFEVPYEKVECVVGKCGETIRCMNEISRAHVEMIEPPFDGEEKWFVRITADKDEMDSAKQMVKDAMNQTRRKSYLPQSSSTLGPQPTLCAQGGPPHAQPVEADESGDGSSSCSSVDSFI